MKGLTAQAFPGRTRGQHLCMSKRDFSAWTVIYLDASFELILSLERMHCEIDFISIAGIIFT
jgi:hypothetical protein